MRSPRKASAAFRTASAASPRQRSGFGDDGAASPPVKRNLSGERFQRGRGMSTAAPFPQESLIASAAREAARGAACRRGGERGGGGDGAPGARLYATLASGQRKKGDAMAALVPEKGSIVRERSER